MNLKLIAQCTNISDYENKSKEDLIKALSKTKPKLVIKKNKLKEIKKDFHNLRHKFSKIITNRKQRQSKGCVTRLG